MEKKELYEYILNIICMIDFLCVGVWETTLIFNYENQLLKYEYSVYNFTFACSALNIINSLTLLWLLFNKCVINNYIILYIMNIMIGILSIQLYNTTYIYDEFYNVIITEMIMFYIKCIIIIIFACSKIITRQQYDVLDTI